MRSLITSFLYFTSRGCKKRTLQFAQLNRLVSFYVVNIIKNYTYAIKWLSIIQLNALIPTQHRRPLAGQGHSCPTWLEYFMLLTNSPWKFYNSVLISHRLPTHQLRRLRKPWIVQEQTLRAFSAAANLQCI